MQIKLRKKDIYWNYAGMILSLCSNIVVAPLIIRFVNGDYLGLWYIFTSIGALSSLFDFGFNPTIARNVAYAWSGAKEVFAKGHPIIDTRFEQHNYDLLNEIACACQKIYFIISFLVLVLELSFGSIYIYKIASYLNDTIIYISWIIFAFAVFLNIYIGYYQTLLWGIGGIAEKNKAMVISRLVQIMLSVTSLIMGFGILGLSIASFVNGLVFRLLCRFYYNKIIGCGGFTKSTYSSKKLINDVFLKVWYNAWRDGLVTVSSYLSGQAMTIICSMYLSLSETGSISLCLQVVGIIAGIAIAFNNSCNISIQSALVNKNKLLARKLLATSMIVYSILYVCGVIGFVAIGVPFIHWIKPSFHLDVTLFVLMSVNTFFIRRHTLYCAFISNMNILPYVKSFIISGFISVIASVMLAKQLSAYGIIIGSFLTQWAYNNWKWPKWVYNYFDTSWQEFTKYGTKELYQMLKQRALM